MKVKEFNVKIAKEMENKLAELYNNYIERKEEFERDTKLEVVKSINCYKNCIIRNARNKFILGKIYKNCISIGSGDVREFDRIEEVEKLSKEEIEKIEKYSKI